MITVPLVGRCEGLCLGIERYAIEHDSAKQNNTKHHKPSHLSIRQTNRTKQTRTIKHLYGH